MKLTKEQRRKIEQLLSVFETGSPKPAYGKVTNMRGDVGGLTYGLHQTTLTSGNLYKLIAAYVAAKGKHASDLKPYLTRLRQRNTALNNDKTLHAILRTAGDDPVMQDVQDEVFGRIYWDKAHGWAVANGFTLPLSMAVIYDSFIHSGGILGFLRNRFPEYPPIKGGDEKQWIEQYVAVRDRWLRYHISLPILRLTVYRTETFRQMIKEDKWHLESPLKVRSFTL